MEFSVALCTYNGGRFIAEQLASIRTQSVQPRELVVCDDGSTDNTLAIVEQFAAAAPFAVRVVRNAINLRSTANFAQAISLCTSDVIVLCDQDDRWRPEKLARFRQLWTQSPETDLVFTDAELIDETGASLGRRLWDSIDFTPLLRRQVAHGEPFRVLLKRYIMTGATMAFRSGLRDRVLPISPDWVHDAWIAVIAAATESRIALLSEPLTEYRQHAGQQIGSQQRSYWQQFQYARSFTGPDLLRQANEWATVADRVAELRGRTHPWAVELQEKAAHLRRRARARQLGWQGWPTILGELITGRYERYSRGWKMFLVDLIG
jgi:glycosyltransferase involved in cell wall biosynthesis